jgi:hypothetical protein
MESYPNIFIDRKQAQQLAVSCIGEISNYVDEHSAEFEEFLKSEENKQRKNEEN